MKYLAPFVLLPLVISLSSCSSYMKRKQCESTNWFDYGQSVALDGRRLSGDQFIMECMKAEADVAESDLDRGFKSGLDKYCQPDTVFQVGKNGSFFSAEMCVGEGLTLLQSRHRAGVLEYCQRSNGYAAGAKGKAYNKICPASLEGAFLPEFNRGRKRYLQTLTSENSKEIAQLENEIIRLQSEINWRSAELQRYRSASGKADEASLARINDLNSQINSSRYSLNIKQEKLDRLRQQNREIQLEIVQLGQ